MSKDIPAKCENPLGLLRTRQKYPLSGKIYLSQERIREWYEYWDGAVYVSFSGGKDSTVLLDMVRECYPDVPAVFSNTGLEYPEVVEFVKTIDNVTWIKPKLSFVEVIRKYGYPVVSKDVARKVREIAHTRSDKLRNKRLYGDANGNGKIPEKWKFLLDAPFEISEQCCYHLKKSPFHKYERETGRKPFVGTMADESADRISAYIRQGGCNAFAARRAMSTPLSFWNTENVWEYIKLHGLPYSRIYDMGAERTGCMWCMFGVHLEKEPNRFQRMAITHPKIYDYCINKLELGKVMDYIGVNYKPVP